MTRPTIVSSAELAPADTPQFRPGFHFTPKRNWMNDPNGLVFENGTWHLFFQHYPDAPTWGPMHWGHASSQDLIHWQEHPIALAPDALGMIFSGSVVIDTHNSSGLGTHGQVPWIAIFTHHDAVAEQAGHLNYQHQSLAFSLDQGQTWQKYAGNPALPNPGLKDLRDPKVFWHAASERWIMSLAAGDHIAFYSSPNLKDWTLQSRFGIGLGAHGGVWECPDLIALDDEGQRHWVLLVSLVPGGPNGGSGTQYFIGDFDGQRFTTQPMPTRWVDYGPDNYAGVTWHNTGARTVFIAWMSNWTYAKDLPTVPWRSAMTLPRELSLRRVDGQLHLSAHPAREIIDRLRPQPTIEAPIKPGTLNFDQGIQQADARFAVEVRASTLQAFTLTVSNEHGDALSLGYDAKAQAYWIDRTQAGNTDFHPQFSGRHSAPRIAQSQSADLTLFFDRSSVELFADDGLTSMTSLHFPRAAGSHGSFQSQMSEGSSASPRCANTSIVPAIILNPTTAPRYDRLS